MFLTLPTTILDTEVAIALSITGFAGNARRLLRWNGWTTRISDLSQSVFGTTMGIRVVPKEERKVS